MPTSSVAFQYCETTGGSIDSKNLPDCLAAKVFHVSLCYRTIVGVGLVEKSIMYGERSLGGEVAQAEMQDRRQKNVELAKLKPGLAPPRTDGFFSLQRTIMIHNIDQAAIL